VKPSRDTPPSEITIFICGPSACEHVWDGPMIPIQGTTAQPAGYTVSCSKCGRTAFDEDQWL
jgi:hypothetical protein